MDQGKQNVGKQKSFRKMNRISKSYTDISSQISGSSGRRFKDKTGHHRSIIQNLPSKKIDYDFLRNLLGVGGKMGERKRTSGERFLNDELKEAVFKLRGEVENLKLEIKDKNWLKTLEDLGDIRDMNLDLLEALYMLRNAYKRGMFSSTNQVHKDEEFDPNLGLQSPSKDLQINQLFLASPEFTMNPFSHHNHRCSSPISTASHVSSDWSSDLESTTSSVAVKRRPAKPRIHLSSASLTELMNRDEEVLVLQAGDSIFKSHDKPVSANDLDVTADNDAVARPGSADSSTSYLNCGDDLNLKPSSEEADAVRKLSYRNTPPTESSGINTQMYEEFRSDSPTSFLLRPLFQHEMSSDLYEAICNIRSELSPKLSHLRNLENDLKLLPVLQVKLAVLQEEKRQLMSIIKQKRGIKQSVSSYQSSNSSSPNHSRGSSPTSFVSDADDAIMIRPSPRRAMVPKEAQTEDAEPLFQWQMCPYCLKKMTNNNELIPEKQDDLERAPVVKSRCEEEVEIPQEEVILQAVPSEDIVAKESNLTDASTQSYVEQIDAETAMIKMEFKDTATGDNRIFPDLNTVSTETSVRRFSDKAIEVRPCEKSVADASVQNNVDVVENSCQADKPLCVDESTMSGCAISDFSSVGLQSSPATKDASFGEDTAVRVYRDNETQHSAQVLDAEAQCMSIAKADEGVMCGCGFSEFRNKACETFVPCEDFQCGDGPAEVVASSVASQISAETCDASTSPVALDRRNFSSSCNFDKKESITAGFGEHTVNELLCDACENRQLVSVDVGSYNVYESAVLENNSYSVDYFCRTDDKLCECEKPQTCDIALGDANIDKVICDICENKTSNTIGCSDDRTDITPCDRCDNITLASTGCGDNDVNELLCQRCIYRGKMVDKEVGSGDVFENRCEKCYSLSQRFSPTQDNHDKGINGSHLDVADTDEGASETRSVNNGDEPDVCSEVYRIMAGSNVNSDVKHQPVICNYCGNKVDINDPSLDDELAKMRENFSAFKAERLAATRPIENLADFDKTDEVMDGRSDAEESDSEDDIDDGYEESTRNDIVESCKMLQNHFSGEKPLKQQLMLKYLANIESLWFQTVKKKRANAAVVKSYIDLFQSRIPELVDTIINLMDVDGNTALHFALTYKNTSVVSILLDSNVCQIDLVNKAGYSPVMLAALAGFDNKTDKYVMQRLLRMGDLNCKNKETGQTPLMFAVSRSNVGMVELLLDAGADVNETDNDGSTALMCACENGSMAIVKALLSNPDCDSTIEDHEGSTALTIAMDAKRRDLALLIYGSLNFDVRGRIKLTPSKQSLLGLGTRRSPSPVIGKT